MKILKFSSDALNSFITRDIELFSDVSFLHGINGSGKTTILRAIASLLTPDPLWLLNATYKTLAVELEHAGNTYTITAEKASSSVININVSGGIELEGTVNADDMRLGIKLSDEEYLRHSSDLEEVNLRIRNLIESIAALSFIAGLPSPIFLGLDRTTLTQPTLNRNIRPGIRARTVHAYFRTQLDDAIVEAERLLSRQLSVISSERNLIFEQLRNQFVLSLFAIPEDQTPVDFNNLSRFKDRCINMKNSVLSALEKINIDSQEINEKVEPFFREIEKLSEIAAKAQNEFSGSKRKPADVENFVNKISPLKGTSIYPISGARLSG